MAEFTAVERVRLHRANEAFRAFQAAQQAYSEAAGEWFSAFEGIWDDDGNGPLYQEHLRTRNEAQE